LRQLDRFELRDHVIEIQWSASRAERLVFRTRFTVRKVTVPKDQISAVNEFLAKYAQRQES
jgi:hypothetical protein